MGIGGGGGLAARVTKTGSRRFLHVYPVLTSTSVPNAFFSDSPGNVAESEIQKVENKGQLLLYSHHPPQ